MSVDNHAQEFFFLQEYSKAVQAEDATFTGLADLIGVEKLELADTFVVVVLDADASVPLLDLTFGSPKAEVNWVGTVQD